MNDFEQERRNEAVRSLINIAVLEVVMITVVIVVYLYTGNVVYLVGGVVGAAIIAAPMFLRWVREHGATMTSANSNDSETKLD